MSEFKISFVQVFDNKVKAMTAFGAASTALPDHTHQLVDHCQQVQLRTAVGTEITHKAIGDADDVPVYMILSIAPE